MPYGYDGKYVIHGPPGCGKTTRIARTVKRILEHPKALEDWHSAARAPVIVCSLTTAAAKEAAGKITMPGDWIGTLHSFGYRSIGAPDVLDPKTVREEWNRQHPQWALSPALFQARKGREKQKLDPGDREEHPGDYIFLAIDLIRSTLGDLTEERGEIQRFAEAWKNFKRFDVGKIDYTDMIELAESCPLRPGIIVVDEAQDMSAMEWEMVRRFAGHADSASIFVGDPYQCLFAFRGSEGLRLLEMADDDHEDSLGQSYRVPEQPRRLAKQIIEKHTGYRDIPYKARWNDPTNSESGEAAGEIRYMAASWNNPHDVVDLARARTCDREPMLILASCGYLLDPTIDALHRAGVPYGNRLDPGNFKLNPLGTPGHAT